MSGFLQLPEAALDLATDWQDECIVYGLYRLADSHRYEPFKAASRMLRSRFGNASGRRVEAMLSALVGAGLVEVVRTGTPRNPRVIRVLRWKEWSSGGEGSVPGEDERNAGGNAGGNAPPIPPADVPEVVLGDSSEALGTAGGNAAGNARRARSTSRPQTTYSNPPQPPTAATATAGGARSVLDPLAPLGLDSRTAKACRAAGLDTPKAIAALSRSELRRRQGIGAKSVQAIDAGLARLDMALQPDQERPKRGGGFTPDETAASNAWAAAWREVHGGQGYAWELGPGGRDRQRVRRLQAMAKVSAEDPATADRLRSACVAYLRAHQQGQAWPRDGMASLATFLSVGSGWLSGQERQRPRGSPHHNHRPTGPTPDDFLSLPLMGLDNPAPGDTHGL